MAYQQPYGQQQQQYGGQPFQQPGFNPCYGGQQGYGGQQQGYQGQAPPPGFIPPPMPRGYMPTPNQAETGGQPGFGGEDGPFKYSLQFNEKSIRMAFVRKVFCLVTLMLAVVAAMTAIPFFNPDIKHNLKSGGTGWFFAAYGAFFVTYLVLICCEGVRRSFPMNLILTGVFTVATGFMTMCLSVQYTQESVLMGLVMTTLCCGIIIVFAMQTKYDLTSCMGVMALITLFIFVFGIVAMISAMAFKVYWLHTVYSGLACLMFMAYLAIDVQMLMGGRKYEISPEDHIFAALQLFLDIIYIFWFILSLFGQRD